MRSRLPSAVSLTWILLTAGARGDADVPARLLRVQLRVERASDARLFERVRGQTSDLPIALERYAAPGARRSFDQKLAEAVVRCRERGADAVAWTMPAPGAGTASWIVALATCRDGNVLTRRVAAARPALQGTRATGSGALEAVALVLRGALSVLAQGAVPLGITRGSSSGSGEGDAATGNVSSSAGTTASGTAASGTTANASQMVGAGSSADGQVASSSQQAHATQAVSERVRPTAAATSLSKNRSAGVAGDVSIPARNTRNERLSGLALLGWEYTWDGTGSAGQPALYGLLSLGRSRFQLGVTGSFSLGTTHADRYATLMLARHSVAGEWRQRLWRHATWSLSGGVDGGCLLYRRETRAHGDLAEARSAALSAALFVSPFSALARRLGPLWIALTAALDVLPRPTRFVYRLADGTQQRPVTLWSASPRIALSLSAGQP